MGEAQQSALLSLQIEKEEAAITLEVCHCQHSSSEPRNYFWTPRHKKITLQELSILGLVESPER